MSKIQDGLMEATGLKPVRGEDRQDLIKRIMKGVTGLNDKEWGGLTVAEQDWFNEAADAQNAKKKVLPDFPDLEDEKGQEEEKPTTRRRGGSDKEEAKADVKPKVGVVAKVTTKRGKTATGKIVELDDDVVVLKMGDGSEEEFARDRVESIEVAGSEAAEEEAADPVKVGVEVILTTKRGKEVTGKIVEMDGDLIVIDVDGKDEEFSRDRVESIKPVKAKAASTRRGASKDEDKGDEGDTKPKRSSNPAGVSVGGRIRELMCEDTEITEAEVGKVLTKEGLEFRDPTLKMIFKDTSAVFELLKKNKKLK